eukprot:6199390-Pleurochrysis_carterae.AAC.1
MQVRKVGSSLNSHRVWSKEDFHVENNYNELLATRGLRAESNGGGYAESTEGRPAWAAIERARTRRCRTCRVDETQISDRVRYVSSGRIWCTFAQWKGAYDRKPRAPGLDEWICVCGIMRYLKT